VVRYRDDVSEGSLGEAVDALLKEMEKSK